MNSTNIVLIPKCDNRKSMRGRRPISPCNVVHKIMSKLSSCKSMWVYLYLEVGLFFVLIDPYWITPTKFELEKYRGHQFNSITNKLTCETLTT